MFGAAAPGLSLDYGLRREILGRAGRTPGVPCQFTGLPGVLAAPASTFGYFGSPRVHTTQATNRAVKLLQTVQTMQRRRVGVAAGWLPALLRYACNLCPLPITVDPEIPTTRVLCQGGTDNIDKAVRPHDGQVVGAFGYRKLRWVERTAILAVTSPILLWMHNSSS